MFDRSVDGEVLEFGVSGLLYQSNVVMYDRATESLWSQTLGESIAGEHTGAELDILLMQVVDYGQVKEDYPDARVLSVDTGHDRNYWVNPYAGYEDSERTYFPIEVEDERYFAKELFWIVPLGDDASLAIRQDALTEEAVTRDVEGRQIVARRDGGAVVVEVDGDEAPGYLEMWFSWATHHQDDGVVWDPGDG